jgi:hypothetical protein
MKTCVVRRRFWAAEADNRVVRVQTEPGFGTPKACMIMYAEVNAATDAFNTALAQRNLGIGFVGPRGDGVATILEHCAHITVRDNQSPTQGRRQNFNTRAINAHNNAGTTIYYRVDTVTFGTDFADFTFTNQTPQTNGHLEAIITFFGGDDITVGIGTVPMAGTAGGNVTYSALNFRPDVIIGASVISALNAGLTDDCRISFGAATRSPLAQKSVYWHYENGADPIDCMSVNAPSDLVTYSTSTGVGPYNHTISGITTGGFTLTSSDSASGSNNNFIFLAIKGASPEHFALTDLNTSTSTGNVFTSLGSTGFVPKTLIGAAVNATADNTRTTTSPGADSIQFFGGNRSNDSLYFDGVGTIFASTASATVTGTGTSFYRYAPGFKIYNHTNSLIGTISTVSSQTSIALTANAAINASAGSTFVYSDQGQHCISFGDEDGNNSNSFVFSQMSSRLIALSRSSGESPSDIVEASLVDFDTRPGFTLNYTLANASARKGWILAFENTDNANQARRRTDAHY